GCRRYARPSRTAPSGRRERRRGRPCARRGRHWRPRPRTTGPIPNAGSLPRCRACRSCGRRGGSFASLSEDHSEVGHLPAPDAPAQTGVAPGGLCEPGDEPPAAAVLGGGGEHLPQASERVADGDAPGGTPAQAGDRGFTEEAGRSATGVLATEVVEHDLEPEARPARAAESVVRRGERRGLP